MSPDRLKKLTEEELLKLELVERFGQNFVDWLLLQQNGSALTVELLRNHLAPEVFCILIKKEGGTIKLTHEGEGSYVESVIVEDTRKSPDERGWVAVWQKIGLEPGDTNRLLFMAKPVAGEEKLELFAYRKPPHLDISLRKLWWQQRSDFFNIYNGFGEISIEPKPPLINLKPVVLPEVIPLKAKVIV